MDALGQPGFHSNVTMILDTRLWQFLESFISCLLPKWTRTKSPRSRLNNYCCSVLRWGCLVMFNVSNQTGLLGIWPSVIWYKILHILTCWGLWFLVTSPCGNLPGKPTSSNEKRVQVHWRFLSHVGEFAAAKEILLQAKSLGLSEMVNHSTPPLTFFPPFRNTRVKK